MDQISALSFLPVNAANLDKLLILALSKSLFNKCNVKELKPGSVSYSHCNIDHKRGGFRQPRLTFFQFGRSHWAEV